MRIRPASNTSNTVRVGIIACCVLLLSACAGSPAAPASAPASVPAAASKPAASRLTKVRFSYPVVTGAWVPFMVGKDANMAADRGASFYAAVAEVPPGVDPEGMKNVLLVVAAVNTAAANLDAKAVVDASIADEVTNSSGAK